jgi:O-methyltransferase involved in polyketide biosynthesis
MEKLKVSDLGPIQRTLLIPLYCRAAETRRPDALIRDETAVQVVEKIEGGLPYLAKMNAWDKVFTLMRVREFDHFAKAFLREHPAGVVVDIGCGLDTRFERLDNGLLNWVGLDLPDVITLRKRLLLEKQRACLVACSALDFAWLDCVPLRRSGYLFLAEGVLPYFEERDVKRLVLTLRNGPVRYRHLRICADIRRRQAAGDSGVRPGDKARGLRGAE